MWSPKSQHEIQYHPLGQQGREEETDGDYRGERDKQIIKHNEICLMLGRVRDKKASRDF